MKISNPQRWLIAGLLVITLPWAMVTAKETFFPWGFQRGCGMPPMPHHPRGMPPRHGDCGCGGGGGPALPFAGGMMLDLPPVALEPPPPFRSMDLSEAQKDKLFELTHALTPALRAKAKSARQSMLDLRQLLAAETYDANQGQTLAQQYGQALAEIVALRAENEAKIRALLTPEQKAQWDKFRAEPRGQCVKKEKPPLPPKENPPLPQ